MKRILFIAALLAIYVLGASADDCLDISQYNPNPNCPAVYNPVCGCDGKTYGNACVAIESGVLSYTSGRCESTCFDPDTIDQNVTCPAIVSYVCGCNGVTYTNACEATYYNGIIEMEAGQCPPGCRDTALIDTTIGCLDIYDPVCGCDSVTYGNSCEALYYYGVPSYSDGPCPLYYCKDFSRIDSSFNCVPVNQPVCGCDGVTYPNSCTAEKYNGVGQWTNGACVTGIKNSKQLVDLLNVYPNPAQQVLWLELPGNYQSGSIHVLNISGTLAGTFPLTANKQQLDVSELPAGTYFIQIVTPKGTAVKRISIMR